MSAALHFPAEQAQLHCRSVLEREQIHLPEYKILLTADLAALGSQCVYVLTVTPSLWRQWEVVLHLRSINAAIQNLGLYTQKWRIPG